MARGRTIIVGGGVGATLPFTEQTYPVIVNDDPAAISAGNISQSTDAVPKVYIGAVTRATNVDANVTIIGGGSISQNGASALHHIVIGQDAVLTVGTAPPAGTDCIVIGPDATMTGSSQVTDSILIGQGGSVSVTSASGIVAIGPSVVVSAASSGAVVIGNAATCSILDNAATVIGTGATRNTGAGNGGTAIGASADVRASAATAVGASATARGGGSTAIGANSTASNTDANFAFQTVVGNLASAGTGIRCTIIGQNITNPSNLADVVALGRGFIVTAANTIHLGTGNEQGVGSPCTGLLLGGPDTFATYGGMTIRTTNGTGSNNAVGDLTIIAPRGTGNASTGGRIIFQVGEVGASSSTLQTANTAMQLDRSTTADDIRLLVYDASAASLKRVTRGAADSGGVGFRLLRIAN